MAQSRIDSNRWRSHARARRTVFHVPPALRSRAKGARFLMSEVPLHASSSGAFPKQRGRTGERQSSLLTTYWSESTLSS